MDPRDKDDHLIESCITSENVWKGRLLDVRRDVVRLPDGSEGVREYVTHPGAVVIIPVLPNGKLIFEWQYRYPVSRVMLELPAGKIDPDEDALKTAQRELKEETGHTAQQWRHLATMHPTIGYANERIEIYLAQNLTSLGKNDLDKGEFLELVELSMDEAFVAIREGRLTDGKTLSAMLWAEKILSGVWS
ncbi:MAG: ADP-ribose pyrophosphatase [Fluviibacter phosphoraccumulans EoVTN8]